LKPNEVQTEFNVAVTVHLPSSETLSARKAISVSTNKQPASYADAFLSIQRTSAVPAKIWLHHLWQKPLFRTQSTNHWFRRAI
jgi:hypothetical protein